MADSLLQNLTNLATPAAADILYLVADPGGTPADRKATIGSLAGALSHGSLLNLATGDSHTQYLLLAGRTGGQAIVGPGLGAGIEEKILSLRAPTNPSFTILTTTGAEATGAWVIGATGGDPYAWIVEGLPLSLAPAGHGCDKIFRIDDSQTVHWTLGRPTGKVGTRFDVGFFGANAPSIGKFNVINDLAATYPVAVFKGFSGQTGDLLQLQNSAGAALVVFDSAGKLGIGTAAPAPSALLDLTSTTGALLPPRMTTTQRDALTAVDGMILYNVTTGALNYRKAGVWTAI